MSGSVHSTSVDALRHPSGHYMGGLRCPSSAAPLPRTGIPKNREFGGDEAGQATRQRDMSKFSTNSPPFGNPLSPPPEGRKKFGGREYSSPSPFSFFPSPEGREKILKGGKGRNTWWFAGLLCVYNDPSAGSPTETLLRLLLPLNDKV